MAKNISMSDIFDSVVSISRDCLVNKRTFQQQNNYGNGSDCAMMKGIIFRSDTKLFWDCEAGMCLKDCKDKPNDLYLTAYNEKAMDLGIPPKYFLELMVLLTLYYYFLKIDKHINCNTCN